MTMMGAIAHRSCVCGHLALQRWSRPEGKVL